MSRAIDIETPLGPGAFVLLAFSGRESLGQVSQFSLTLKSKRSDIDANKILGQNVTVRLQLAHGKSRYFNGYITRWSGVTEIRDSAQGPHGTKAYLYEATMSPWLWFLSRQSNSRIYQNKTVPDIVLDVFNKHGDLASFKNQLNASYRTLEYCVQYHETDLNFVSRLMEQEGIYYNVLHEDGQHAIHLYDSTSSHRAAPGYEELRFDEHSVSGAEVLSHWQSTHEIQPGRYVARDYNYLKPRTHVDDFAERVVPHPYGGFEYFDFPAEVNTPEAAKTAARIRLDELQSNYHTFAGGGELRGLQPGQTFKLARHPVPAFNDQHLIVSTTYQATGDSDSSSGGSAFSFQCGFAAIPIKQQYRPPRVTPKPLVNGPQTAVVVGQSGEEIETDAHGRIKVQFRWDRYGKADQNSSCWIRVAQTWAGNGYGALALPRIGQEVVVGFMDGDPDCPLVTGSVYNGDNKPPYNLPAEKTRWGLKSRSSKGGGASNFNELRFEDKKGAEEVYVHAEKDQTLYTKNKRTEYVGGESHLQVKQDVLGKFEADVHQDIKGDDITKVGGGVHLTVAQDWQAKLGTKLAVQAGNEIHLKAGTNVVIEAGAQLSLKVGGSFITINSGGVYIKGPMVMINSGGAAGSGSGASPKTPKSAAKAPGSQGGTDRPVTQKAAALKAARASATPFCEICEGGKG